MKSMIALAAVLALAACAPPVDHAPPRPTFVLDGATYEWALAHGAKGGLLLLQMDGVGTGKPIVIMTCRNRTLGGLQIRYSEARQGPVTVEAGDATFAVDAVAVNDLNTPAFEGEGPLPTGWFRALAKAEVLQITYETKTVVVQGPGAPSVEHYERYCTRLGGDQRR